MLDSHGVWTAQADHPFGFALLGIGQQSVGIESTGNSGGYGLSIKDSFRSHLAEITCWRHLESSRVIWSHLEASGRIWNHLEASGVIWRHLESSGVIWRHLESS